MPTLREAFSGCKNVALATKLQQTLQRYVRDIAKDLGVDATTAALEYRELVPLVLQLTAPGRPLATGTNNEVWQRMLEPDVRLSHMPQRSAMRAFEVPIRFYISIEDGECPVERDLGDLTQFDGGHTNGAIKLADALMLTHSDTTTVVDICVGGLAVGSDARLGAKGRRWATSWRAVYGARLGCYNKRQGKRVKRAGTYVAAKAGVLAAAEYAVATSGAAEADDVVTPPRCTEGFFEVGPWRQSRRVQQRCHEAFREADGGQEAERPTMFEPIRPTEK